MRAVVLAAGRGERMMPLTAKKPKPMLEVDGIPLIGHVLVSLPYEIEEIIVVVDYLGEQIKEYVENVSKKKMRFVQGSDKGNVYSFLATRECLDNERFLLIYGDEIPTFENVYNCLKHDLSVLTFNDGEYDGVMVLNTDIFDYEPKDENFKSLVEQFVAKHDVELVEAKDFIGGINTPKDLERAEKWLKSRS